MSEKTKSLEPNSHSSNQQKSQIGLSIASDAIQFGFWLQKYLHYFYHFRSSQATETCQAHACSIFMNLMKSCRIVVLLLPSKSQDLNSSLWKLESEFEVTSPTLFFFLIIVTSPTWCVVGSVFSMKLIFQTVCFCWLLVNDLGSAISHIKRTMLCK